MERVVAIDAHKASFTFVVRQGREQIGRPKRRENRPMNLRGVARTFPGSVFVLEACGPHEWMHDILVEEGARVFVCHPPAHEKDGVKNDAKDADRLAMKYLSGELKQVWIPPPELRRLREVVRQRSYLVAQRTRLINRVKHELNRWNATASDVRKERERIVHDFPHLSTSIRLQDLLDEEIKKHDAAFRIAVQRHPVVQRLESIPGFGDVVGLAFYVEIGDINRFPHADALVRYLGLDPVWKQSADSLMDLHKISKRGDNLLRGLLTQAAWVHVNTSPESDLTQDYHRLVSRGKPPRVAIIAVERKLVSAAYSVWKHDRDFTMKRPATIASCRPHPGTRRRQE